MSIKSKLLSCSALVFVIVSPVAAETNASKWTGLSAIVGGSYSVTQFSGLSDASAYDGKSGSSSTSTDIDFFENGSIGGFVGLGYDFEVAPNLVVGVRGLARFGGDTSFSGSFDDSFGGKGTGGGTLDYFGSVGNSFELAGRFGWTPNENALVYIVAGVSAAKYTAGGGYDPDNGSPSFGWEDSGTILGPTIGIGVAIDIGNQFSIGLEANHAFFRGAASTYEDKDLSGSTEMNMDQSTFSVFLGKRF